MGKLCSAAGCGEYIQFIRCGTRWIPVADVEPEAQYVQLDKPGHPQVVIVTPGGQVLRGRRGTRHEDGVARVEGWESHLSHCPGAGQFRGRQEEP